MQRCPNKTVHCNIAPTLQSLLQVSTHCIFNLTLLLATLFSAQLSAHPRPCHILSAPAISCALPSPSAHHKQQQPPTNSLPPTATHTAAAPTSRLQKAISGSIIQNSARCLLVWLFSALKVGPKVYTLLSPHA